MKPYPMIQKFLMLAILLIGWSSSLNAQNCFDDPALWQWAIAEAELSDCCIGGIVLVTIEDEGYIYLIHDANNCANDGPAISTLYDCDGNVVCTDNATAGELNCTSLLDTASDEIPLWVSTCIEELDECFDPSLVGLSTCDDVYEPVCGCDGITYDNGCFANNEGIAFFTQGACPTSECVDSSLIDLAVDCITLDDPVCGCDGITYGNSCEAEFWNGVTEYTQGACGSADPCETELFFYNVFIESWGSDDEPQTSATVTYDFYSFTTNWLNEPDVATWDFGNGTTATGFDQQNIEFTMIENEVPQGPYEVCVTASWSDGSCDPITYCEEFVPAPQPCDYFEIIEVQVGEPYTVCPAFCSLLDDYEITYVDFPEYVTIDGSCLIVTIDEMAPPSFPILVTACDSVTGLCEDNFIQIEVIEEEGCSPLNYTIFESDVLVICPNYCDIDESMINAVVATSSLGVPMSDDFGFCFTYIPNISDGVDTIVIQAALSDGDLYTEEIFIEISSTSVPITAVDLEFVSLPGETVFISFADFDGYTFDYIDPAFGVVEYYSGGIIYTPDDDFIGLITFVYTLCDIVTGDCTEAIIFINIGGDVAPIPILQSDVYLAETSTITICPLENDELNNLLLTFSFIQAAFGTVEQPDPASECLLYTPPADFAGGFDYFTYTLCDENGFCYDQEVTIFVNNNLQVIANNDYESTDLNTELIIQPLSNDQPFIDPSVNDYTISVLDAPTNGIVATGVLTDCFTPDCQVFIYTPNINFQGADQFTYLLCLEELGLCDTATVYLSVGVDCTEFCVWPGDANNDGVANNFDLLLLGQYFGGEGPERPNASTDWTAQQSFDWSIEAFPGPDGTADSILADAKYADCNGDGSILADDVLPISLNYGLTHGKGESTMQSAGPLITLSVQEQFIEPGMWIHLDVFLGDDVDLEEVYGTAFTINYFNEYEGEQVIVADSIEITYANDWFNNNGSDDLLTIEKNLYELDQTTTKLDVGMVRTNKLGVGGGGQIASVATYITQNITGKTAFEIPLNFYIENAVIMHSDGEMLSLEPNTTELVVENVGTGISELPVTQSALITTYPNPANDYLNVFLDGLNASVVKLYGITGQLVFEKAVDTQNVRFATNKLNEGIYLLYIETDQGFFSEKIEIRH